MIFVTGMLRSGTTLAAKVVAHVTGVPIAAQPFPLLFTEVKNDFLLSSGQEPAKYPLSDCVFHNAYDIAAFEQYLEGYQLKQQALERLLRQLENYSGQQTRIKIDLDGTRSIQMRGFSSCLSSLLREARNKSDCGFSGCKETTAEEFVPYLARQGWFVVLVIRDIRDVLTSANYGLGSNYTGQMKPALFNVRQWRKSVIFALRESRRPNVFLLRYEDLVGDPVGSQSRLYGKYLKWAEANDTESLSSQRIMKISRPENSSFGKADSTVGRYKDFLDPGTLTFIESLCWHEMKAMNYNPDDSLENQIPNISDYNDQCHRTREELSAYLWTEETHWQETARKRQLIVGEQTDDNLNAFIFPDDVDVLNSRIGNSTD